MNQPTREMAAIMADYKTELRRIVEAVDRATDLAANRLQNLYFKENQTEEQNNEDKRGASERRQGTSAGGSAPSGLRRSDRPRDAIQPEIQP